MHVKARVFFTIAVSLLLIATLVFIWGNSLESMEESGAKSKSTLRIVAPLLEAVVGGDNATEKLVRKLAHFTEFFALGNELALLIVLRRRVCLQGIANCLSAGLAAAVTDEALQLLSARGSQVSDVLLDFGGAATGVFFILLIYQIVMVLKKRKIK